MDNTCDAIYLQYPDVFKSHHIQTVQPADKPKTKVVLFLTKNHNFHPKYLSLRSVKLLYGDMHTHTHMHTMTAVRGPLKWLVNW